MSMGVDHGGGAGDKSPRIWSGGIVPPDFVMLQNFKHQITCITMQENVFLPLQQDFYISPAMPPPNSSQFYACGYIAYLSITYLSITALTLTYHYT